MDKKVEDIVCWIHAVLQWAETVWKSETWEGGFPRDSSHWRSRHRKKERETERRGVPVADAEQESDVRSPSSPQAMLVLVNILSFSCFCSSITKHLQHSATCTALGCSQTHSKDWQVEKHNWKEGALLWTSALKVKKKPTAHLLFSLSFYPYSNNWNFHTSIIEITPSFSQK